MGFTKNRSTMDAIFALLQAVAKRRQHGADTWMAFIDLRKAYPSVPRHVLFRVLEKFGIPSHFRQVLRRFYTDLTVKVDLGSTDPLEMPAGRTGLREGCRLSPILWLFMIQAVLSLVEPLWKGGLQFRTCLGNDRTLAGKPAEVQGTLRAGFSLWKLLLADDMWVAADTKENLITNLNTFVRIGKAFGLEMHAAKPGTDSKTLAMMVPAWKSRNVHDLRAIQLEDGRTVPFAKVVKYLGTMISSDWTDTVAVKTRIDKANGMFAMNKQWLCSKDTPPLAKARYYETCVVAALLYGAEAWRLTKRLRSQLQSFHNMKIRQMAGVTKWHTRRYRIKIEVLEKRLGVQPLEWYLASRALRWVGHVSRMGPERLPMRLAFGWVELKRQSGGQAATFASTTKEHLRVLKMPTAEKEWLPLTRDARAWNKRMSTKTHEVAAQPKKRAARGQRATN